jgi:GTPase
MFLSFCYSFFFSADISDIDTERRKRKINDVRIAVVGNVDSGKSTLIGVLTGGQLDNGRGLARSRVCLFFDRLLPFCCL